MTLRLPPARPLPERHAVLTAVFAAEPVPVSRWPHWWPAVAATVTVLALVAGAGGLSRGRPDPGPAGTLPPAGSTVQVVLQRLNADALAEATQRCATGHATDREGAWTAVQAVRTPGRPPWPPDEPVVAVLLREPDRRLRACYVGGGAAVLTPAVPDPRDRSPSTAAESSHAVLVPEQLRDQELFVGGVTHGQDPRSLEVTGWYAVSADVASMRMRWWVSGQPGPWFESTALEGYVALAGWADRVPLGAPLAVEIEVLDEAGRVLSIPGTSGLRPLVWAGDQPMF